jgi:small conductance mechanosensitive channel
MHVNPAMLDLDRLGNLLIVYGIDLAGAIVVAIAGWWLASLIERAVRRAMQASGHVDPTVVGFLSSIARYATLIVALVVVLQLLGVQATSLVAVIGAASLAIGLALQGTLANIAAGVMLLIYRPFQAGDQIEVANKKGRVQGLNLFMTELASDDNNQILIPNSQVWGQPLTNFTAYARRRDLPDG